MFSLSSHLRIKKSFTLLCKIVEWETRDMNGSKVEQREKKTKADFFYYFPVESTRNVKIILQVDNETMQMEYQTQQHVLLSPVSCK